MKTDILIVSYAKDFQFCEYNIRSIYKFCKGFRHLVLLVPTTDVAMFGRLMKYSTEELPLIIKTYLVYPGKGFNHHQIMKCYADVLCQDADFILHTDSDCMFTKPTTPSDYFVDGKPVLLMQKYEELEEKGALHWKPQTERALGVSVDYEFMRRHPAVHYAITYSRLRNHIERTHATSFFNYVILQKNEALQGFSEFNALGAFAHFSGMPYLWWNVSVTPPPDPHLIQFWSWDPKGVYGKKEQMDSILA